MKPLRILIVDDEKNMRTTLADILAEEGYQVDMAESGEAAIAKCQENTYHVILMDVRMSGIDGIEALRQIRGRQQDARVMLMSAYPVEELKQVALKEGAIAFLPKPLNIESLVKLIEEAGETITLVVDDDEGTTTSLQDALRQQGYRVSITGSASEALKLVEQIHFDLVFISAHLPTMNGLQLYLAIKEINPRSVAIMMSEVAGESWEIAKAAVEKTAYTVIRKPLDFDEVLPMLRRLTPQRVAGSIEKPPPST